MIFIFRIFFSSFRAACHLKKKKSSGFIFLGHFDADGHVALLIYKYLHIREGRRKDLNVSSFGMRGIEKCYVSICCRSPNWRIGRFQSGIRVHQVLPTRHVKKKLHRRMKKEVDKRGDNQIRNRGEGKKRFSWRSGVKSISIRTSIDATQGLDCNLGATAVTITQPNQIGTSRYRCVCAGAKSLHTERVWGDACGLSYSSFSFDSKPCQRAFRRVPLSYRDPLLAKRS